ncbi:MAG: hypothetical protein AAFV53_09060 [Myxococcota bacterium]
MRDPMINPRQSNLHFFLPLASHHNIPASAAFFETNESWLDWHNDFEEDLSVEDRVDTGTELGPLTREPFPCAL